MENTNVEKVNIITYVLDDDKEDLEAMGELLSKVSHCNYELHTESESFIESIQEGVHIAVIDYRLDGMVDGVDVGAQTPMYAKVSFQAPTQSSDDVGTFIAQASSAPDGAYTANSLSPDFYNSAGVRSGNNFVSSNHTLDTTFLIKTKYQSRDAEATTYFENGWLFLREANNKALYLFYDKASGLIATGVVNDMAALFTYTNYNTAISTGIISGLSGLTSITIATTDSLTFRADGFNILVKKGSADLISTRQYSLMQSGSIACKALR